MVLPLVLLLLLGVFEFARAWNAFQVITDAAREGARMGVVASTPPKDSMSVVSTVRDALTRAGLPPEDATIEVSAAGGVWPGNRGDPVTVAIRYPYQFLFVGRMLSWLSARSEIALSTAIVMRKE